jgi:hypothetical protein
MFQREKKLKNNVFFFSNFFQVPRDPRIAVGDDNYAAVFVGLKCFKGRKIKIKNFQNNFQVPRDPCIAVGDYGYVAALVGLKCFKEYSSLG